MDSEQLSRSLFKDDEEEEEPFSFKKAFMDQYPYYIHLGMSYDEYWRMDCELVRAYRKAYEYKQEYDNSQLWLQGLYVYRALEAQRPGWAFYGKKTAKPEKYMEKPIAVTKAMREQYAHEETQKMAEQFRQAFHARNKKFMDNTQKEGDDDGTG